MKNASNKKPISSSDAAAIDSSALLNMTAEQFSDEIQKEIASIKAARESLQATYGAYLDDSFIVDENIAAEDADDAEDVKLQNDMTEQLDKSLEEIFGELIPADDESATQE